MLSESTNRGTWIRQTHRVTENNQTLLRVGSKGVYNED